MLGWYKLNTGLVQSVLYIPEQNDLDSGRLQQYCSDSSFNLKQLRGGCCTQSISLVWKDLDEPVLEICFEGGSHVRGLIHA